jgi:pimeloyl-ACP methyl ester carboxylesterase
MLRYLGQGMDAYVRWREERGAIWPEPFRTRMLANDPAALSAFLQATPGHYPLELTPRMNMPALVISADDDELMAGSRARRAAAGLPDGRYLEIPDADHPALYLQSHRVAPFVRDFISEVSAPLAPAAG